MREAATDKKPRKQKKRADGEGSLRWSEKKGLWIGRVMVGYRPDGKPDVREVTAKAQKTCKERLDALKAQAANGTLPAAEMAGMTVSAFLDRWLDTVKPNLRTTTYTTYRGYVETHIKPGLGSKRLAKLSHDDVQAFLNARRGHKRLHGKKVKTLSARSLHHLYVIFGTALNWGVKKGYIPFSPMLRVDAPRVPKSEVTPLTPEQTAKLLYVAEEYTDPLRALWMVAAYTGARKGELLGLTWGDVDLEAGTINIRRALRRFRKGVAEYDQPKTARSRRVLDLAPDALAALKAHRDRQAFAVGRTEHGADDIVFASEQGTPLDQGNVTRRFKRALKRAGLPETVRLHDLRHGAATMMLEAGETVPTVSEYLGHASPDITMRVYVHAIPGAKKRAAERLGAVLRRARPAPEAPQEGASSAS